MKRALIGLLAVAVLVGGGWFGFNLYVQHRTLAEVETAFDQIRSSGGKASHGKVAFDLATRTLTVDDIAIDPAQQAVAGVKLASLKATGLSQGAEAQLSADTVDIADLEFTYNSTVGPAKVKSTYKVPQIAISNFSGAIRAERTPASGSIVDIYRFALDQLSTVGASSVTVPTIAVTMDGFGGAGSGEVTYSGLAVRNIGRGKIDTAKADRAAFTLTMPQSAKPDKLTGEISNIVVDDFDASAILATLDPDKANDDSYHRAYRQLSAGPYVVTSTQGVRAQVDGVTVEDIAFQPSKFRLADLLALLPKDPSVPATPAQAREMLEKLGTIYEGVSLGKAVISNLSVGLPQGTARLNAVRYAQGEFALEGLDAPAPQGQFKMERFALKSFSIAALAHWAARVNPGQTPSPDQMLGLLRVLEGAEVKGIAVPYKNTKKLVSVDTLSLDWSQLVGPVPSKARVVAKFVTPTDPTNPLQLPLTSAGIDKLAIDLDVGAAWTESSGAFALTPATLDIGNLVKAQVRLALANVPRDVFTTDRAHAMSQAEQIETGAIELSLRDSGAVDLVVAQFARMQNLSRDAARSALVEMVRKAGEQAAPVNPDAKAAVDAIASFVATPGQTLAIKLTPLGKVPGMQLMRLLNTEPIVALAQFRIEASTGL